MTTEKKIFGIQRGGSLIDAINAKAAATGSPRCAQLASHADYNGHAVTVAFNDYRGYFTAEYFWAGREVLARGSFADCLEAALREFNRGAKFASIAAGPVTEADVQLCLEKGLTLQGKPNEANPFYTDPMMLEINGAFWYQQQLGVPAVSFLANSKTVAEYKAKVDEYLGRNREAVLEHGAKVSEAFQKNLDRAGL